MYTKRTKTKTKSEEEKRASYRYITNRKSNGKQQCLLYTHRITIQMHAGTHTQTHTQRQKRKQPKKGVEVTGTPREVQWEGEKKKRTPLSTTMRQKKQKTTSCEEKKITCECEPVAEVAMTGGISACRHLNILCCLLACAPRRLPPTHKKKKAAPRSSCLARPLSLILSLSLLLYAPPRKGNDVFLFSPSIPVHCCVHPWRVQKGEEEKSEQASEE